jgi:hypothetical protein
LASGLPACLGQLIRQRERVRVQFPQCGQVNAAGRALIQPGEHLGHFLIDGAQLLGRQRTEAATSTGSGRCSPALGRHLLVDGWRYGVGEAMARLRGKRLWWVIAAGVVVVLVVTVIATWPLLGLYTRGGGA